MLCFQVDGISQGIRKRRIFFGIFPDVDKTDLYLRLVLERFLLRVKIHNETPATSFLGYSKVITK